MNSSWLRSFEHDLVLRHPIFTPGQEYKGKVDSGVTNDKKTHRRELPLTKEERLEKKRIGDAAWAAWVEKKKDFSKAKKEEKLQKEMEEKYAAEEKKTRRMEGIAK
jgi:hypothetical protein